MLAYGDDPAGRGPSDTMPRTSTFSPTRSTQGARMKTACSGPPGMPVISTGASKESTCRPKALRRTVIAMPSKPRWSGRPSSTSAANMIMPAQEP